MYPFSMNFLNRLIDPATDSTTGRSPTCVSALIPCLGILCLGLIGCSSSTDSRRAHLFLEAERRFEEAEELPLEEQKEAFRRVAAIYQGMIDRGIQSGAIYYNQGNAWARCDERARAIVAYRLARRYRPLDPYIASNLQALGNIEPPTPLVEHLLFWQDWFGVRSKAVGAITLIALTFVAGMFQLFVRHRRLCRLALILFVLSLISSFSVGYDWFRFERVRYALIAVDSALPRKGNSEQYGEAFTTPLSFGTTGIVVDRRGEWLRLRFGPEQDGWIPTDQVIEY